MNYVCISAHELRPGMLVLGGIEDREVVRVAVHTVEDFAQADSPTIQVTFADQHERWYYPHQVVHVQVPHRRYYERAS